MINQSTALFLIVIIIAIICLSAGGPYVPKADPAKECADVYTSYEREIIKCKDKDELIKWKKKVDSFRKDKKYKRVEAMKGYSGDLFAKIEMKRSNLN